MNKVHYTTCPVCDSQDIGPLLTVKDYSVSGEEFVIWQCSVCSLRFTQDAPDESSMVRYYKSPDYISHSDTAKGLINKLYQKVRILTLQQKKDLIIQQTGVTKGTILDVGAGTGAFLQVMKMAGWKGAGVEPDEDARRVAKNTYGAGLSDASFLYETEKEQYDAITLWHVLEHVHPLHAYIDKLRLLLKEEGKLFIAVPNYTSLDNDVYRLFWAAYDVPRHLYHFAPKSIELLMKMHHLKVAIKKPMWFDAFYISLLSSKYKNGSSHWLGASIAGLKSNAKALFNRDSCSSIIYVIEKLQS